MQRILLILLLSIDTLCVYANDSISLVNEEVLMERKHRPHILREMESVEVIQDSMMSIVLNTAIEGKRELVEIDGYRVQVYSSNQQQTAKSEALDLEEKLKENINQTIYVLYQSPFWKVRIGDFRTYDEAREYKKIFTQLYPNAMGDTYIVRDKIKVMQ